MPLSALPVRHGHPFVARLLALACGLAAWPLAGAAHGEEVDLQLVLAADVSGSMSRDELRLQREGYVVALRSRHVAQALASGAIGRAALTYVEWAGVGEQKVVVPWTVVASARDLQAFANLIENGAELQPATSSTSLSSALEFGAGLLDGSGNVSYSRVIDISGDGPNDAGPSIDMVRQRVVAQGIVVNGLPIALDHEDDGGPYAYFSEPWDEAILQYYDRNVIGGAGAFVLGVAGMDDFPEAIERKLVLEIAGTNRAPATRQWLALMDDK